MRSVPITGGVGPNGQDHAGICLASLEPSDAARVARTLTRGVSNEGSDCHPTPFLFADGRGRDPDKYRWLPHPPPRVLRERPITYLRFWGMLGGFLAIGALEVWGAHAVWEWVARVLG